MTNEREFCSCIRHFCAFCHGKHGQNGPERVLADIKLQLEGDATKEEFPYCTPCGNDAIASNVYTPATGEVEEEEGAYKPDSVGSILLNLHEALDTAEEALKDIRDGLSELEMLIPEDVLLHSPMGDDIPAPPPRPKPA